MNDDTTREGPEHRRGNRRLGSNPDGHESIHVRDVGLNDAPDEKIIQYAHKHGYYCLTLDADFHAILALSGESQPSVIRFRIEGLKAPEFLQILQRAFPRLKSDMEKGALVSIRRETIRNRPLPIKRSS